MNRALKITFLILQILITCGILTYAVSLGISSGLSLTQIVSLPQGLDYIPIALHSVLLLIFGIIFFIVFGKATYPEVTFIMIAASLILCMNLRIFLYLPIEFSAIEVILIQKVFYTLWMLSFALIFCSGLFHNGISYLKQNFFILISLCITLIIMVLTPISNHLDSLQNYSDLLSIKIIIALLGIFSILNYITASVRNNTKTFFLIALGVALFLAGNVMFLYLNNILQLGIASILLIIGSFFLIRKFYTLHLWS